MTLVARVVCGVVALVCVGCGTSASGAGGSSSDETSPGERLSATAAPARRAAPSGVLVGKVELSSGCGADSGGSGCNVGPLPNAQVVVTTDAGQVLETLTGTDGGFRVTVPAGACLVVAAASGVRGVPARVVVAPGTAVTGPVTLVVRGVRHPM